jgi:hypothetical protein
VIFSRNAGGQFHFCLFNWSLVLISQVINIEVMEIFHEFSDRKENVQKPLWNINEIIIKPYVVASCCGLIK